MYFNSTTRLQNTPLDVFRLIVQLEETKLVVADTFVWVTLGDIQHEVQFFLSREDSKIYITEIGDEEE